MSFVIILPFLCSGQWQNLQVANDCKWCSLKKISKNFEINRPKDSEASTGCTKKIR